MHKYLTMTNEELFSHVTATLKRNNPLIVFGDRLRGSTDTVYRGKLVDAEIQEHDMRREVIALDFKPPRGAAPPHIEVKAECLRILFQDVESYEFGAHEGEFIYPFSASIPHCWLSRHKPGDKIMVRDEEWWATEITLTQEIYDSHCYIVYKFAVAPS